MNIAIYKGKFQYDVVNYFVDELCREFKLLGHEVFVLDLCKMTPKEVEIF